MAFIFADSHPSTSNSLALTSGMAQGKAASADCPPLSCPQPQASIFSQLGNAGRHQRGRIVARFLEPEQRHPLGYQQERERRRDGSADDG